jgi:hypothetical protein
MRIEANFDAMARLPANTLRASHEGSAQRYGIRVKPTFVRLPRLQEASRYGDGQPAGAVQPRTSADHGFVP